MAASDTPSSAKTGPELVMELARNLAGIPLPMAPDEPEPLHDGRTTWCTPNQAAEFLAAAHFIVVEQYPVKPGERSFTVLWTHYRNRDWEMQEIMQYILEGKQPERHTAKARFMPRVLIVCEQQPGEARDLWPAVVQAKHS